MFKIIRFWYEVYIECRFIFRQWRAEMEYTKGMSSEDRRKYFDIKLKMMQTAIDEKENDERYMGRS